MANQLGIRVLRGPDWDADDEDGGEGHVGTVIELLSNQRVRVLWDTGQESTCRAGTDGKFDLRVFDTAQIGVRHPNTKCKECGEQNIYGMLWRCNDCNGCDLCLLCYNGDKHDLRHQFLRIDFPGNAGTINKSVEVPPSQRVNPHNSADGITRVRCLSTLQPPCQENVKTSVKIRTVGMFSGAKVKRGRDWMWGEQDGGAGLEGEVKGYENVAPDSSRNLVRVQWSRGGPPNSYRVGFQGQVDLVCVEEDLGPFYYRDHLPVLGE
ncbi:hypothetical protein BaRGS_00035441 [Batillaria attramentaria]|uniref:MIB/HERC2 domain-containing protein n=1 Tax=Batillaria attramentaria TaxID=370345 RepID=A0ABD0JEX0_9CAEN